jgi:ABC-2 type transport system permease protein
MTDVLAAEWRKLRSVPSTLVLVGLSVAAAGIAALLAVQVDILWDRAPEVGRANSYVSDLAGVTAWAVQLCLALFGALAITSEYSSGMIRTTFTAVPRRGSVLAAKAGVVGTTALLLGAAVPFAAYGLTRLILGDRPVPGAYAPFGEEVGLAVTTALLTAVYALFGLGLGTVLRSAAGTIVTIVACWYLVPIIAIHLPPPWDRRIGGAMLIELGQHGLTRGALLGMALYAAVPMTTAAILLKRRDA